MGNHLELTVASGTHVGLVRKRNEDSYYQGRRLFVVADGLGGHVAGDIASATAVEAFAEYDRSVSVSEVADALGRAVYAADDAIRQRIAAEPALAGMGTTVVAILQAEGEVALANIGDSRAYLLRREGGQAPTLRQISEDHVYRHLLAHVDAVPQLGEKLTRFLDGRKDGRSPDISLLELYPGDRLLLCSDGLSSYVPIQAIEEALVSKCSPWDCVERLIALALDGGGKDNVTVIVLDAR
ncbi:PP2C family protein-serine/threonine phosphatase [Actinoplanes derwentensis]|uniref:Serine/threonine protein phosphatase PrpC n=1 Tax=Actinoplanes derwentensis TaxID=113562 RepID=A0A1H1ZWZ9_9ACTN|nr:protein phosphatase 2C domain-containing protein [Actinoplanes derwentensis]GID83513.1 hypothetical protein Ade03nite_24370 [Actinoplanes derwentensis]SDT37922.1 Serine/threonine protein phosphatase PrpC [Actinoplanes derwentensis]